jgi:hypothetical protein
MENQVYKKLKEFKEKHPLTISWRIKHHAKVIEAHLNPGETVLMHLLLKKMIALMIFL